MSNLKDVAKKSNVSIATVSRYINNKGFISDKLRSRIESAIKELSYSPNRVAQGLSKGRTGTIGIIIPDITNPFFPELVKGASDYLFIKDYHVHLCSSDNDPKKEELFLKDFQSMWVDGIIIAPSDSENRDFTIFNQIKCPKVIVDREIIGLDVDLVVVNNEKGSLDAVNYLIENGHKKIIFLGGSKYTVTAQKRYSGWKKAMESANLITENLAFWGNFSTESGYQMMKEVMKNIKNIDAIFASNDLLALGVIEALREKGLNIPKDISIISFDDIYVSRFLTPPLTTIKQPIYEIGKKSAEILLYRILKKSKRSSFKKLVLEGNLVIRNSVRKVN